jgi:putative ABC transport system substrate-binding protein
MAAKQATSTIPIVAVSVANPVESGLVASLARPGSNLTGLAAYLPGLESKWVDLLRESVPGLLDIAAFVSPVNSGNLAGWEASRAAAEAAGISVTRVDVHSAVELDAAFETAARHHAQAVIDNAGSLLLSVSGWFAELALRYRLAAIGSNREPVDAGLLMAYGADRYAIRRRAGTYLDRILKGTKPADLPVEQPVEFEFIVNSNTARTLGLIFPSDVTAQVTEWVM